MKWKHIQICTWFLGCICVAQTHSQQPLYALFKPMSDPIPGVQFSISLSNRVMTVGSTNTLLCYLTNSSTNKIAYFEPVDKVALILLTNTLGKTYQLSPDPKSNFPNASNLTVLSFTELNSGASRNWSVPVVINKGVEMIFKQRDGKIVGESVATGKDIDVGTYELYSCMGYYTTNAKYCWGIQSNPLSVKVVKGVAH